MLKLRTVDDRPRPFSPTGRTRRTCVDGKIVTLGEYKNRDGLVLWASSPPKRRPPNRGRINLCSSLEALT